MQHNPIKISIKIEASHSTGDMCECEFYSQSAPPTGISIKLIKCKQSYCGRFSFFFSLKIISCKFMESLPCGFIIGSFLVFFFALARKTAKVAEKKMWPFTWSAINLTLTTWQPMTVYLKSHSLQKRHDISQLNEISRASHDHI